MEANNIEQRLGRIERLLLAQKNVLNFEEVADYTGLSHSYLYKLTSACLIPHSKPNGKQVYFNKTEIDTWLLRNRQKTHDEIEQEAINRIVLR